MRLTMRSSVGIMLGIFILFFSGTVLFGLMNTLDKGSSLTIFKTAFFIILMVILGIAYLANTKNLQNRTEHIAIILCILIISSSIALAAGKVKYAYDTEQYMMKEGGLDSVQQLNNYYLQYAKLLDSNLNNLKNSNAQLESQISTLTDQINNRPPNVVENVVHLPAQVIYVYQPSARQRREIESGGDD